MASPFVLVDPGAGAVAGYYTLSAASVPIDRLPAAMAKKLPRYGAVPATLLGRLAVDRRYRGKGYGAFLLIDALRRSARQSDQIASFAVMVDAKDDAARSFYEHHGLLRIPHEPYRLFLPMKSIAQSLQTPENGWAAGEPGRA